jgi:hypothetical protein
MKEALAYLGLLWCEKKKNLVSLKEVHGDIRHDDVEKVQA